MEGPLVADWPPLVLALGHWRRPWTAESHRFLVLGLVEIRSKCTLRTLALAEAQLSVLGRNVYVLFGHLMRRGVFSLSRYYKAVLATAAPRDSAHGLAQCLHLLHLPLLVNAPGNASLSSQAVVDLATTRRALLLLYGMAATPASDAPDPTAGPAPTQAPASSPSGSDGATALAPAPPAPLGHPPAPATPVSPCPSAPDPPAAFHAAEPPHLAFACPLTLTELGARVATNLGLAAPPHTPGPDRPLLETLATAPPYLCLPLAASLGEYLQAHLGSLTAIQLRQAALILLVCGDACSLATVCINVLTSAASPNGPCPLPVPTICTLLQMVVSYSHCFRTGTQLQALAHALVSLYRQLAVDRGRVGALAGQVRVRFLEVLSCNRHLFLELDVLGVLTEKCSGWGLRDSDTGAKVAALMEDARKVLNSDGGVAKGVAKSGLLDGFPPHFCFPSAAARPLVPTCGAAQRSSNVVTKTVAVSQKAAPLKPKPKEEHKPQPWESAIVQVMRKQLEEPAKDKDAASYDTRVRVAARAFAAQAGQSSETLLPALSHLVQRFLCAVLSYIHTGKHEHALQHARGYLCIMREAGAQALQDGRIVAMMTTCFPNLRNPAALLGHYYYRLLYTGLEKVHGKKEAEGYAKDMGATTAAVACFMVTAVTRQLVTVEAVVGALGDVLEDFSKCKLHLQPALCLDVLHATLRLVPTLLDCNPPPGTAPAPAWPLPREHRAWSAQLEQDYGLYCAVLHSTLRASPAAVLSVAHLLAVVGRLWAQCSTVAPLRESADLALQVLAATTAGRTAPYLALLHGYCPVPLHRDVFPALGMRDPAWQRLLQRFLTTSYAALQLPPSPLLARLAAATPPEPEGRPGTGTGTGAGAAEEGLLGCRAESAWSALLDGLLLAHCWDAHCTGRLVDAVCAPPPPALDPPTPADAPAFPPTVGLTCCASPGLWSAVVPVLLRRLEATLAGPPPGAPPPPPAQRTVSLATWSLLRGDGRAGPSPTLSGSPTPRSPSAARSPVPHSPSAAHSPASAQGPSPSAHSPSPSAHDHSPAGPAPGLNARFCTRRSERAAWAAWLATVTRLLAALQYPAGSCSANGDRVPLGARVLRAFAALAQGEGAQDGGWRAWGALSRAGRRAVAEALAMGLSWYAGVLVAAEAERPGFTAEALSAAVGALLAVLSSPFCVHEGPATAPVAAGRCTDEGWRGRHSAAALELQVLALLQTLRCVATDAPQVERPPQLLPNSPNLSPRPQVSPSTGSVAAQASLEGYWQELLMQFADPRAGSGAVSAARLPPAMVARLCFCLPCPALYNLLKPRCTTLGWVSTVQCPGALAGDEPAASPHRSPQPQARSPQPAGVRPHSPQPSPQGAPAPSPEPAPPQAPHAMYELPPFKVMEDTLMMPCDGCRVTHSVLTPALWGGQPLSAEAESSLVLPMVIDQ